MKLAKVFISDNCPKCPQAKKFAELLKEKGFPVQLYDTGTADGLAEAVFHGALATPSILVVDEESEDVVRGWRGVLPGEKDVIRALR